MRKNIPMPEDFCNYVEGLMYETNARKDVIAFMLNSAILNQERFDQYHKEYLEFYAKYELVKNEIQKTYVDEVYGNQAIKWNLNFKTQELEIDLKDEK